ncbi:MAG: hypothetical protein GY906_40000 [bacterium]|nr:hypothetical protein [bacterium]
MDTELEQDLRNKNRELRRENRRYRELIETLSSQADLLRQRLESAELTASSQRVFESFAESTPLRLPLRKVSCSAAPLPAPLAPPPGWKCLTVNRNAVRLGFTLFGTTRKQVKEAVDKIEQRQLRSRDFVPIFATDLLAFDVFRSRGYVVEYVAPAIATATNPKSAEGAYRQRRLDLIKAKWNLNSFVDLS